MFHDRVSRQEADEPGYASRWERLRERLLSLGESWDVVPPIQVDEYLDRLLCDGALVDTAAVLYVEGEPSRCHENVVNLLAGETGDGAGVVIGMGTGYALSEDGLWRQHSWAFAGDGALIETTVGRVAYYGIRIDV